MTCVMIRGGRTGCHLAYVIVCGDRTGDGT